MSQAQRLEMADPSGHPQSPYLNRSTKGGQIVPSSPLGTLIPRDYLSQRSDASQTSRPGAGAVNPRKTTPSPLQSSHSLQSSSAGEFNNQGQVSAPPGGDSSQHPAPRPSATPNYAGISSRSGDGRSVTGKPHLQSQLRNVSSSTSLNASPPNSPTSISHTTTTDNTKAYNMPRNASIDSTVSAASSTASHSHKSSVDTNGPSAEEMAKLIASAGSPESLIQRLLVERQHTANRENQLWRLLEKQKAMLSGLNRDLERALKDKESLKMQLHEKRAKNTEKGDVIRSNSVPKTLSRSSTLDSVAEEIRTPPRGAPVHMGSSPLDPGMVPPPLHLQQDDGAKKLQDGPKVGNSLQMNQSQAQGDATPRPEPVERMVAEEPKSVTESVESIRISAPSGDMNTLPPLAVAEPSPLAEKSEKGLPVRKAPPAPLNLNQQNRISQHLHQAEPGGESDSEYDDILEVDEIPTFDRGRRKTREEDDRVREAAALREMEARSRSKKQKLTKSKSVEKIHESPPQMVASTIPMPSSPPPQMTASALPLSPRQFVPQSPPASLGNVSAPSSIAAVLSPPLSEASSQPQRENLVSSPPMSPGLPASPRPGDRPIGSPLPRMARDPPATIASPPMSPRNGMVLSPRAPKHPIPLPPNTPLSVSSPPPTKTEMPKQTESKSSDGLRPPPAAHSQSGLAPPGAVDRPPQIYRGFVTGQYPGLLLPPNALPSVEVKTASSRMRPSRNSYMAPKATDEEPVFTLSIFSRSDGSELWRLEKVILSLPQLDHQLRQFCDISAKIPDRQLFTGHSPAKIDARRAALDSYFDLLLNTHMDENAALALCQFLSTDAIDPRDDETSLINGANPARPVLVLGPDGRPRKEGYLTKRGKNFGGWKARFFVLQGPDLKYYDTPGGPHLGTIKLQHAQIGKQSQNTDDSPSRSEEDSDNQYRHAFLVLEPKRNNASKLVRHVLCAESDAERDAWVEALLKYVDYPSSDDEAAKAKGSRREGPSHITGLNAKIKLYGSDPTASKEAESPNSDKSDVLQTVPYDSTVAAEAPRRGPPSERRGEATPSPPVTILPPPTQPPPLPPSQSAMSISGPTNGAKIEDASSWGNKSMPLPKDPNKEHKKRSIWNFRQRSSSDLMMQFSNDSGNNLAQTNNQNSQNLQPVQSIAPERRPDRRAPGRPVFGMSLGEAVELCPPEGLNVHLPAVVYRCIEYLDAKGAAHEEGIFRLSGSNVVVKALKERFNSEGDVDFLADGQYYDVHAVASLLKLYLRELPTTVLTRELHLDFLRVLELDDKKKKVPAFNTLVHRLPRANWALLKALSQFLITIVNNSDKNKMTVRNVGIVFSPTLNIPAPVFSMFLNDFDAIFGAATAPPPPVRQPSPAMKVTEVAVEKPLTPDDIRSPRHQMFSDIPTPAYNQSTFSNPNLEMSKELLQKPAGHNTGFIPMQPSYEPQIVGALPYGPRNSNHPPMSSGEPQYGSMNRMLAPNNANAAKAKRRESSMLFMGLGQRKSADPRGKEESSMVEDDSAFD